MTTQEKAVGPVSDLDRRRDRMQEAQRAARQARTVVSGLDERIVETADKTRNDQAVLQATLDRAATLKRSIKADGKQTKKLQAAREQAGRAAADTERRSASAESKYSRAVLADMVQREKVNDLSSHGSATDPAASGLDAPAPGPTQPPARPQDEAPTAPSATGPSATAPSATARATAARLTAARAHPTDTLPST